MRGWGRGVSAKMSTASSCAHGAQIKFGDLTPYLTYGSSSRSVLVQGLAGRTLGPGPMSAGHAHARRIRVSAGHRAARLQDQAHATGAAICARTVSRVPARQVGGRAFYSHPLAGSVGNAGLEKPSCEHCLVLCANLVENTPTSL
jgi:hypothetical protein